MLSTTTRKAILGLALMTGWLLAVPAQSQSQGQSQAQGQSQGQTTSQSQTPSPSSTQSSSQGAAGDASRVGATSMDGQSGATGRQARQGALTSADRQTLIKLAQANQSEVEAGRLAQSKSQNEEVKRFAQQMIDDHGKALDEVRQLAQTKGVSLPTDLDREHKAMAAKLTALSGEAFDRTYLDRAGVSDHKKNHEMLRQAQTKVRDPDLKALIARIAPVVDQHLATVQELNKNTARGSSGTQGNTTTSASGRTPATDTRSTTTTRDKSDNKPMQPTPVEK